MSTFEKRAREDKLSQAARQKQQRRNDRRNAPASAPQFVSASDINGHLPSIESVMAQLQSGTPVHSGAPTIPSKLFVGSLSDSTTSAALRAHFEPHGVVAEAVVITDRGTGATRNFGFVTLADRKDAARVINEVHHSELDGKRIVVSVATDNR